MVGRYRTGVMIWRGAGLPTATTCLRLVPISHSTGQERAMPDSMAIRFGHQYRRPRAALGHHTYDQRKQQTHESHHEASNGFLYERRLPFVASGSGSNCQRKPRNENEKNFFPPGPLSLPNRGSVRVMKDEGTGLTWTPDARH